MADEQLYECTESFAFDQDGRGWATKRGEIVSADDVRYKRAPNHFQPIDSTTLANRQAESSAAVATGAIETATASPGERRSISRPKR